MQRKTRFEADQRFDLPFYDRMIGYIDAEFNSYNKAFFSPQNHIVKNWQIVSNGGLQVKVSQATDSLLMNSERTGYEAINYRKYTDVALTLDLTDNATNYVEIWIQTQSCAPDTVALWDSTANGGVGEEYTQTVDTANEEAPILIANTTAFSGDPDKIPLAIVDTAGGVIVDIEDSRSLFFNLATDWNFGAPRTDKTIGNWKEAYDALATILKESKGTPAWYSVPYASTKLLKEYQNMFITGGGTIQWEGSYPASTLGWNSPFSIEIADRANVYTIAAGTVTLADGEAMYVEIPEGAPLGDLTPIVANLSDVPIDPDSIGYSATIQVLFFRRGSTVHGLVDIPELSSGEQAVIGQDLPTKHRTRLGIVDEDTYEDYSSITTVALTDSHPAAISKLDAAVGSLSILSNTNQSAINAIFDALDAIIGGEPVEEHFVVGVGGQTIFNATLISWNSDVSSVDIAVFVNGQKVAQDQTGSLTLSFRKNSGTQIEFSDTIPEYACVTIRNIVPYLNKPYFVNYLTNTTGQTISVGTIFSLATDRLGVYRNGVYLMKSPSLGTPVDRYVEQSGIAVELGETAASVDNFAFVHQAVAPSAKQSQSGLTGTLITVPTYVMGSKRLRVFRNGLMMNDSGFGDPAEQYTETSTTSITLTVAATVADYFVFEVMAAAPAWREDITGITGVTLNFSNPYVMGDKKLLIWKNGVLLFNSLTIGAAGDRYQEATTTSATLGIAAVAADVFVAIYQ